MEFESLALSFDGPVAHIRLTRPELSNFVDAVIHTEFPAALRIILDRTEDVAAVIISAEGPHFMVGVDLDLMLRANASIELRDRIMKESIAIIDTMFDLPYPIITAVQGDAVGLGASILSCSDIVVAARGATIADPHVQLGFVAGDGGIIGWSQSMGIMRAKRYLLTGDPITAEQAYAMGMVTDLADEPDDVLKVARGIAEKIAALPRRGVRGTKRAFSRLTRQNYGAAFELAFAYEMMTMGGEEVRQRIDHVKTYGG